MLRYVGYGHRDWRTTPMPTHRRLNWEFLATLDGFASPAVENQAALPMQPPTLWLFPPEVSHGWTSEEPNGNNAAIFHYSELDPFMEQVARRNGWLSATLSSEDITTIREMVRELWSHYWRPTVLGGFYANRVLATLYLIVLRDRPECQRPTAPKGAIATIEAAERWILNNIADGKAVSNAARAIGVTRPHLYRLIRQIRGCSPHRLLIRLRFDTAKRLMSESDLKLDSVARECGFLDASAFCRAFRSAHGCSPTKWRAEYHIQYRQPTPEQRNDHTLHRYPAAVPSVEPSNGLDRGTPANGSVNKGRRRKR